MTTQPPRPLGEYGNGDGQLRWPRQAVADGGELFIADALNHRVTVLNLEGIHRFSFGTQGSGIGMLNQPHSLTVRSGRIYVADTWNNRVSIFSRTGGWVAAWGGDSRLSFPHALCFAGASLVVASTGSNEVVVFDDHGRESNRIGSLPALRTGRWSRGPLSSPDQLSWPKGVAALGEHVYICDTGHHCIKVFTLSGEFVRKWGQRSEAEGGFHSPNGIAIFGKHAFVSQQGSRRVQAFALEGGALVREVTVAGSCDLGGISADDQGVYVTDEQDHCVWRFWRSGNGGLVDEKRTSRASPRSVPSPRATSIAQLAKTLAVPIT